MNKYFPTLLFLNTYCSASLSGKKRAASIQLSCFNLAKIIIRMILRVFYWRHSACAMLISEKSRAGKYLTLHG